MKNKKENLMKHFASVLRKKALGTYDSQEAIDQNLLKYLTRKELVQILQRKYDGLLPKDLNLVEMENGQILELIENELLILAHFASIWSKEESSPLSDKVPNEPKSKGKSNSKR